MEVRRETGETATAYAENATAGMQIRFNIWPGDGSFGGVFDPSILPVYQYIDWVQYSSYTNGAFELAWREDFDEGNAPTGWSRGTWDSAKGLSTHSPQNVTFADGFAVLALTDDAGSGTGGASSSGTGGASSGTGGAAPSTGGAGASQTGGSTALGGSGAAGTVTSAPDPDESGCACRAGAAGPQQPRGLGLLLGAIIIGLVRRQSTAKMRGRRP
jgi:MYXO-CTERM domain-containing protein